MKWRSPGISLVAGILFLFSLSSAAAWLAMAQPAAAQPRPPASRLTLQPLNSHRPLTRDTRDLVRSISPIANFGRGRPQPASGSALLTPHISGDEHWSSAFALNGVNGPSGGRAIGIVYALASDGHNLYVAGEFTTVDHVLANNIAMWDGISWSPLGTGTDSAIRALALDASGNLYAGGDFNTAGGVAASRIAEWNGRTWSTVGSGIAGANVKTLAFDRSGNLYAGGFFWAAGGMPASNIAKWNGLAWSPLGGGVDREVSALAFNAGGNLFVGGSFQTAGGAAANAIAQWDGSKWSALGSGMSGGNVYACMMNPCVLALTVDPQGRVYAGGSFSTAGGVSASNVARWDGNGWSPLASGIDWHTGGDHVTSLTVDSGGNVYAGSASSFGSFGEVNGAAAMWNGSTWSTLGTTTDIYGIQVLLSDSSGRLYVGGAFGTAGGKDASGIARWNGAAWSPLGPTISNSVDSSVYALNVSSGSVFVGGEFGRAGTVQASAVAQWNGTSWSALGSGMSGGANPPKGFIISDVQAFARDSGGNLYATGNFTAAGGVPVNGVARWNGSTWAPLAYGLELNYWQAAGLLLAWDNTNNVLYAGGAFDFACASAQWCSPGTTVNNIGKWDGAAWSALDKGLDGGVGSLAWDDTNKVLYAGGGFSHACADLASCSAGTSLSYIAKWDGAAWSSLGGGASSVVSALALDAGGNLYAGGVFETIGGVTANGIAKWNGSTWAPLGSGVSGCTPLYEGASCVPTVLAIAVSGSTVYIGGDFTSAGGIPANHIAKWDGTTWSRLGSGTDWSVDALALNGTDLYVGGPFSIAGGKASAHFALWSPLPTVSGFFKLADKNQSSSFSSFDFTFHFADVDGDPLSRIKIVSLPSQGTLKLGATPVALNQEIPVGSLGSLTYAPPPDWVGSTGFSWTGSDGTDYAAAPATTNIIVAVLSYSYLPFIPH